MLALVTERRWAFIGVNPETGDVPLPLPARFFMGRAVKLFEGNYVTRGLGFGRPYDVASDGERFVMMKPAGPAADGSAPRYRIVVVQNWHEELKRLVPPTTEGMLAASWLY